ncbi:helix-turn-helix transcriptional regulator [Streptomyces monticola]|uniref:Helix-turn-helix transcriptional regulator n=1 Tax=Streptomyces monticola TaxID=2666263 RepID=A0ABW2JIU9_9ACTN
MLVNQNGEGVSTVTKWSTTEEVPAGVGVDDPSGRPGPVVPGDPEGVAALTGREREVLGLVGVAAGNRGIAQALGIAERTVKAHLTNIMGKIGVSSRLEAAVFAYAYHDLISVPQGGGIALEGNARTSNSA